MCFSFDYSLFQWSILLASALIIGISKTGLPGGGVLAIPLVALVLPAKASTGLILPMLIAGDVFAVAFYRRHADWRHLFLLMPWAVLGILLGYSAMFFVTDAQLRPIIGVVILVMLAMNEIRSMMRKPDDETMPPASHLFASTMGVTGGAVTMMANAAGPVISLYMLAMRLPKNVFVGTAAWYFMMVNCIKVPFSAHLGLINAHSLALNLLLLPMIIIGALCGIFILKRLPEKFFGRLVVILAAVAALKLLF